MLSLEHFAATFLAALIPLGFLQFGYVLWRPFTTDQDRRAFEQFTDTLNAVVLTLSWGAMLYYFANNEYPHFLWFRP